MKVGVIGCGFFAQNHLAAWQAIEEINLVAVCDQQKKLAEAAKTQFKDQQAYDKAEDMLANEDLDFVDIVTTPASHRCLVELAARYKKHVICQKPLAPTIEDAKAMVNTCQLAEVNLMVHENFRWQGIIQKAKQIINSGTIGDPLLAQISFRTGYNVYPNQPYLAGEERLVLYDMGTHIFDLVRFYMGEVSSLYAQTHQVNPNIQGEDAATVLLHHPKGSHGSLEIRRDYQLNVVSNKKLSSHYVPPTNYSWGSSLGGAIMESVVNIQRHWVECLNTNSEPHTSGADNLKTLALVFGSYESAEKNIVYHIQ